MANNINQFWITGNLTRTCGDNERDFGYIQQTNSAVANITIANNRGKKNADGTWGSEVSYFDVRIYGKTAENLKPYLLKGTKVAVKGYHKQERWEDKQTGKNISKIVFVAEEIELCGKAEKGEQSSYAKQYEEQSHAAQGSGDYPDSIPF